MWQADVAGMPAQNQIQKQNKYNGLGFDSTLYSSGYIVTENVTGAQGAAGTDVAGMCGRHPCKKWRKKNVQEFLSKTKHLIQLEQVPSTTVWGLTAL